MAEIFDPLKLADEEKRREQERLLFGEDRALQVTIRPQPKDPLPLETRREMEPDASVARKNRKLADEMGVDPTLVEADPQASEVEAKRMDQDELLFGDGAPVTTRFLERPGNMEQSHDSVSHLSQFEEDTKDMAIGTSFGRGVDMLQQLGYRFIEATGEITGSDTLAEFGGEGAEEQSRQMAPSNKNKVTLKEAIMGNESFLEWVSQTVGEQIPMMAPAVAGGLGGAKLGAIVGTAVGPAGTAVGAVVGGIIGAFLPSLILGVGEVQQGSKEINPDSKASGYTFAGGAVIAMLDTALPGKLGGRLVSAFGKDLAPQVARELAFSALKAGGKDATLEGITEGFQGVIAKYASALETGTDVKLDAWEIAEEVAAGFLMGGGTSAVVSGTTNVGQRAQRARRQGNAAAAMADTAAITPLDQEAPEVAVQHHVDTLKERGITSVFVPADVAIEHARQNEHQLKEGFDDLGITEQMNEQSGRNMVEIPIENFVREILASKRFKDIQHHIQYGPEGVSISSVAVDMAAMADDMAALLERDNPSGPANETAAPDLGTQMATVLQQAGVMEMLEGTGIAEQIREMQDQAAETKVQQEMDAVSADPPQADGAVEPQLRERVDKALAAIKSGNVDEATQVLGAADPDVFAVLSNLASKASELNPAFAAAHDQGRVARLEEEIVDIDQRIITTQQLIDQRRTEGKTTARLEQRMSKLIANREARDTEQSDILLPQTIEQENLRRTKQPKTQKRTLKKETLDALGATASKDAVRTLRTGFREGIKAAKKDIKSAQKTMTALIKASGLDPKRQNRFLKRVANMDSSAKFERNLPVLAAQLTTELETQYRGELVNALKAVLKKPKGNQKKVGGLDNNQQVAVNDAIDGIRAAWKLSNDDAKALLERRLQVEDGGVSSSDPATAMEALENLVLHAKVHPKTVSIEALENLVVSLDLVMFQQKVMNKSMALARVAEEAKVIATIQAALGPLGRVMTGTRIRQLQNVNASILSMNGVWWNKLQAVFKTKDKALADEAIRMVSFTVENQHYVAGKKKMTELWSAPMAARLGISQRKLHQKLQKDATDVIDLGEQPSTNESGSVHIRMTRSQMRMRLMNLQNEDTLKASYAKEGDGYTPELIANMEAQMLPDDHIIMESQMKFYKEYLPRIDKAYQEAYGVSLAGKVENYSPTSRAHDNQTHDEFLQGALSLSGLVPGAVKQRTGSTNKLRTMDDVAVLQQHIIEMEYFIAFNQKVRTLQAVFQRDKTGIAHQIRNDHGDKMWSTMQMDLDWFAKKGVLSSSVADKFFRTLMRNFGISNLALKPQILMKQLASTFAFTQDVPIADWSAGAFEFFQDVPKALRLLNETGFYSDRGMNIDQDFADLMDDQFGNRVTNFLGRRPTLVNMMMMNVKFGDKAAIAMGGYAMIRANMKNGMTKKEALARFVETADRTQQSSALDQVSEWQRSNDPFKRLVVQFMSSANAVARAEYSAITEFAKGRIDKKQFAKSMMIYHVLIPNIIMIVANGFNWDWEDQLKATALGATNGWVLTGDVLEWVYSALLTDATVSEQFDASARHPLAMAQDLAQSAEGIGSAIYWDDWQLAVEELEGIAGSMGALTGAPLQSAYRMGFLGPAELAEGDWREGLALMLGWSPYVIDKQEMYAR